MNGAFGLAGPYTQDPGAELQRRHREREAAQEREDRACKWIAGKLIGQTYENRGELTYAATQLVVTYYGRPLTADEHSLIERACRTLASGLCFIATIAPARCLVDRERGVIQFVNAA